MNDNLIKRIETQLASVVTSGSGDISERTIRQYGKTPVCREDIEALIARVRALEAQAARDAVIIDMVDGLVAPFAWTDAMDSDGEYSFSFGEAMVKAVKDGRALALESALAARGE